MSSRKFFQLSAVLPVSLVLSLMLSRNEVGYNASPCISTDVCEEKMLGTKTVKWLGFPAHYDIHTTFVPNDDTRLSLENQGGDTQYSMILINTLFWMFAIYGSAQMARRIYKKNK